MSSRLLPATIEKLKKRAGDEKLSSFVRKILRGDREKELREVIEGLNSKIKPLEIFFVEYKEKIELLEWRLSSCKREVIKACNEANNNAAKNNTLSNQRYYLITENNTLKIFLIIAGIIIIGLLML